MSPELERRYARLLLLYPAAYRRERGAELLATLAESAEQGRRWPAAREVKALVLGGLRTYAAVGRGAKGGGWPVVFRAAALMLLVHGTATYAIEVLNDLSGPSLLPPSGQVESVLVLAFAVGAILAAGRGRFLEGAGAAAAAFVLSLAAASSVGVPLHFGLWEFPLAVAMALALVRHRPAPVTGLLWYAPALPLALVLSEFGLQQVLPGISGVIGFGAFLAFCAGGLVWLSVDERLTMAMGLFLLNNILVSVVFLIWQGAAELVTTLAFYGLSPAVLVLAAAVTGRRRARI